MEQLFYLPSTMVWPLLATLVLTGILLYLGVHVIARKVIFVDLALAQIAALGTVIGVLLGYEVGKDTNILYMYSLAFTIFGAFVFSVTKMKKEKVPHEAIIGIVYAVTFAATILVLSKSALGPQELEHIIKGELLWVQADVVIKTAIMYAVIGLFHFVFRKKFMAISLSPEQAEASGINTHFWDFLFYMSFGFVITSAVAIAGVFLVFSYLVIPSVGAMLIADKLGTRLTIGWTAASIISFIGVKLSYNTGLPTSPAIVVVLAGALMLAGVYSYVKNSPRKGVAIRNLAGGVCLFGLFIYGVVAFRKPEEDPFRHTLHQLASPLSTDRQAALVNLAAYGSRKAEWLEQVIRGLKDTDDQVRKGSVDLLAAVGERSALPAILPLLNDRSDEVQVSTIKAVQAMGSSKDGSTLVERAAREDDPELKLTILKAALELGTPESVSPMGEIIAGGGLFADEAYEALRGHVRYEFTKNETPKFLKWWNQNVSKMAWDDHEKMFHPAG
jgi:zinc/manganese transport system permease protein